MEKKSVGLLELETAVLECFLEKTPLSPLGVKPLKRGIELGWVTRGTRPKNLLLLEASPAKPAELRELGDLGD
jgi:hypothetical protein